MEGSRRIFTEVIKRQMAILGPDITIAKVKNVPGIEIDSSGEVTALHGDPKVLLSELINQFVELSGLIVKKTMESVIMSHPDSMSILGEQFANTSGVATQQIAPKQPAGQTASRDSVGPGPSGAPNTPPTISSVESEQSNVSAPIHSETSGQDDSILSANKDIDELNKMLENISKK